MLSEGGVRDWVMTTFSSEGIPLIQTTCYHLNSPSFIGRYIAFWLNTRAFPLIAARPFRCFHHKECCFLSGRFTWTEFWDGNAVFRRVQIISRTRSGLMNSESAAGRTQTIFFFFRSWSRRSSQQCQDTGSGTNRKARRRLFLREKQVQKRRKNRLVCNSHCHVGNAESHTVGNLKFHTLYSTSFITSFLHRRLVDC